MPRAIKDQAPIPPDQWATVARAAKATPKPYDPTAYTTKRQARVNKLCEQVSDADACLSVLQHSLGHHDDSTYAWLVGIRLELSDRLHVWLKKYDPDGCCPIPDVFRGVDELIKHWKPNAEDVAARNRLEKSRAERAAAREANAGSY